MRKSLTLLAAAVTISAAPAYAQDKKITLNVGGGISEPLSEVKERFGTGYHAAVGVTYHLTATFGAQAEYAYRKLDGGARIIDVQVSPADATRSHALVESRHGTHDFVFSGVFKPATSGPIGGYVLGGIGVYRRTVSLTTTGAGYATLCDPWWSVCGPALVSIDQIAGNRTAWETGFSVGGGVTFRVGESVEMYAEARYHYVRGDEYTQLNGSTVKANGRYFPITFGVRF